jgi:hypothetical protein
MIAQVLAARQTRADQIASVHVRVRDPEVRPYMQVWMHVSELDVRGQEPPPCVTASIEAH